MVGCSLWFGSVYGDRFRSPAFPDQFPFLVAGDSSDAYAGISCADEWLQAGAIQFAHLPAVTFLRHDHIHIDAGATDPAHLVALCECRQPDDLSSECGMGGAPGIGSQSIPYRIYHYADGCRVPLFSGICLGRGRCCPYT